MPRRRQCGTQQVHERLAETDPGYRARRARIERFTQQSVTSGQAARVQRRIITIPVVVHVVYKKPAENISDAQIRSQIPVLNRDYTATNTDRSKTPAVWKGLVASANVRFDLAKTDPNGRRTNGITRTKTTRDGFGTGDSVKKASSGGAPGWPSKKYLNIWVCSLQGGLLGYAQFPGGAAKTDGVVILYSAFGTTGAAAAPFNLGRTATHEIGHWLNLHHIWGDTDDCTGTDYVPDTPNAATPNYNKPKFPHISCNNGPNGDMFMNYMDYVDDAAMFMFTPGQVMRMNAALAGPRSQIGR